MKLNLYVPSLAEGCCVDKIYAIVFDHNGNALRQIASIYEPDAYTAETHADFAVLLSEDSERSKFYKAELSLVSMDDTPEGESGWIEFWKSAEENPEDFSRGDTLLEARSFVWQNDKTCHAKVSSFDANRINNPRIAHSISYDSEAGEIAVAFWAEKLGSRVTNPSSATIAIYRTDTDTQILNSNVSSALTSIPGVFSYASPMTLQADSNYIIVLSITLADSTVITSTSTFTTWD